MSDPINDPTPKQTAMYLKWLDGKTDGLGSAIALVFRGQFRDMGWVKQPTPEQLWGKEGRESKESQTQLFQE